MLTRSRQDYSDPRPSLFFEKAFPEGTKEATLYAVWKENTVTLSYVSADETLGTVSLASEVSWQRAVKGPRFDRAAEERLHL